MSLPPLVEPADELTIDEVRRYSRHLIIPDVGMTGQKRLKNAKVLVIGAGGLGSPALLYLAAAGVGTIGIVEFDTVDLTGGSLAIVGAGTIRLNDSFLANVFASLGDYDRALADWVLAATGPGVRGLVDAGHFRYEHIEALVRARLAMRCRRGLRIRRAPFIIEDPRPDLRRRRRC